MSGENLDPMDFGRLAPGPMHVEGRPVLQHSPIAAAMPKNASIGLYSRDTRHGNNPQVAVQASCYTAGELAGLIRALQMVMPFLPERIDDGTPTVS